MRLIRRVTVKEIYVNLKRFDVPKQYGGICPKDDPVEWVRETVDQTIALGLGKIDGVSVAYFLPEALLVPAYEALAKYTPEEIGKFQIGCESVYREDVTPGKNFGAFTTNRPAAAMQALGCGWTLIGHSEERKDKLSMLTAYDAEIAADAAAYQKAADAVDAMLKAEVQTALGREMNVLFCIGETAEQKGSDDPAVYEPLVREVLRAQIVNGLKGVDAGERKIAIGYEPIWAIGPGKTPPNGDYVAFVSSYIKEVCKAELGCELSVVYGGGLKEENAAEMAAVETLDGGLVALTKFTQPIAFDVNSLRNIIGAYVK